MALMAVVLAVASKTAMRPLRLEDLFTVAAVPTISETASAAAPPVPVTAAAGVVPVVPRPLRLGNVVVEATAKTPLLGSLLAFLFPENVGIDKNYNAEL